jgi:hypothetical protein
MIFENGTLDGGLKYEVESVLRKNALDEQEKTRGEQSLHSYSAC